MTQYLGFAVKHRQFFFKKEVTDESDIAKS